MTTGHYIYHVRRKIYKEDIVEAGYQLMYLNGYASTGIKEITDTVDIPKGSFYNHFGSKQEFGIAVIEYYRTTFMQGVKNLLADSSKPAYQRLLNLFDSSILQAENQFDCKYGCLAGNFSQELGDVNESFSAVLKAVFEDMKTYYSSCIKQAQKDNDIKSNYSANDLADILINAWQGALIRMKVDRNTDQLKLVRKIMFGAILI